MRLVKAKIDGKTWLAPEGNMRHAWNCDAAETHVTWRRMATGEVNARPMDSDEIAWLKTLIKLKIV